LSAAGRTVTKNTVHSARFSMKARRTVWPMSH
jgi:hypothetical protein